MNLHLMFSEEVNDWEWRKELWKVYIAKLPCIYGYGIKANTEKTLGSEWRQYEEIFSKSKSNVDIVSLECHGSCSV
jgi:5-methyltetrahydropteroyltriglutamate--homocysteine methyltransferase